MSFKTIDLFCGCGGLSCGFAQEGFEIIAGLDRYKPSLATHTLNFPKSMTLNADLSTLTPSLLRDKLGLSEGELDCLIGGPPCQGFSKNVPASQRSLDDPRNALMNVFLTFVREFRPKVLLIENVLELVNAYEQAVTQYVLEDLRSLGYNVEVQALNAAEYGVPQLRRRAFFLASRVSEVTFPMPSHSSNIDLIKSLSLFDTPRTPYVTSWDAISDLPEIKMGEGQDEGMHYVQSPQNEFQRAIRNGQEFVTSHVARKLTKVQMDRIESLGEGQAMKDLPEHLQAKKGYSGAYGRLFPNQPARTITKWVFHPGSGRFIHPYQDRMVTIREAARIQSFPDWFRFTGTYIQRSHQIGEAVPPLLVRKLAQSLAVSLGRQ